MAKRSKTMALTEELVRRCERAVPKSDGNPHFTRASDEEREAVVRKLIDEKEPGPLWVFAYGSLIWKPEFEFTEFTRAVAHGWHRSFCLELWSWRGSPEQPGLMMALDRGGSCHGIAYRLPDSDHETQIARIVRREIVDKEDLRMARWIGVETGQGQIRALVFWAGPKGKGISLKLPLEKVAWTIARACGHAGSNAAYLYQTVMKLEEHGIRDRNLWRLQQLVAAEIEGLTRPEPP
jgi:glutathione-specific gamma-glutamylcyclotransferase